MAPRKNTSTKTAPAKKPAKKSAKRAAPADEEPEEITLSTGIKIKKPTSYASRKRRRPGLSAAEIAEDSSKYEKGDEEPPDYAASFAINSVAHFTWGSANAHPILAVEKKRVHGARKRKGPVSMNSNLGRFLMGKFDDGIPPAPPKPPIPNSPERSHLLRIPLEIREQIYGHLLIHEKPVLLHYDCHAVHHTSPMDHTILRICKQIAEESACFLYEKNVFHVVIRRQNETITFHNFISPKFLPFLRNVVIDFSIINFDPRGRQSAERAVGKLIKAETKLDSLTFVVVPRRASAEVRLPNLGISDIRYASFFSPDTELMQTVRQLSCNVLNIVVKLPEKTRVVVSVDIRPLTRTGGWFANDEVAQHSWKTIAAELELKFKSLKQIIEGLVEDKQKAISAGKARLMGDDERVSDGMLLASRR